MVEPIQATVTLEAHAALLRSYAQTLDLLAVAQRQAAEAQAEIARRDQEQREEDCRDGCCVKGAE